MIQKVSLRRIGRLALGAFLLTAAMAASSRARVVTAQPGSPPAQQSGSEAAGRVDIWAHNYAYDAPDTVPTGAVTFSFENEGTDNHMAQFFRLNQGVTPDQLRQAVLDGGAAGALQVAAPAGGINATAPGDYQQVTLDMTPGDYVMLCFVYDEDDPTAHVLKGMLHPFQVAPPPSEAAEPQPDLTVTAQEYSFDAPDIAAGQHVIQLTNQGAQPHEMALLKLSSSDQSDNPDEQATLTDTTPSGGIAVIPPGSSGWATVNFTPGTWMMVCYVPDAATGTPHATLGMTHMFTVR